MLNGGWGGLKIRLFRSKGCLPEAVNDTGVWGEYCSRGLGYAGPRASAGGGSPEREFQGRMWQACRYAVAPSSSQRGRDTVIRTYIASESPRASMPER